jgi:sialate O-acetylesterase
MSAPLRFTLALLALVAGPALARADVKLPPFFSDHMVLQREAKVPIFGTAAPGEEVTVKFRDQSQTAKADDAGNFRVELAPLKAGGPDELTIAGKNSVTLKDVLVGEVWVGSGQSNMAGVVRGYAVNDPVLAELAATAHPQIRQVKANGAWQVATPENSANFSAILFAFGVRLNEGLDVPVGLMLGAVGGTPSGAWLSEEAYKADKAAVALHEQYPAQYEKLLEAYNSRYVPAWEKQVADAKAAGKPLPGKPRPPAPPGTANGAPIGYLYKIHIQPFIPYAFRGVLWDQGESGTAIGNVDQFTMMGALIRGWRKEWGQGDFPFIYVQKPSGAGCAFDYSNPVTNKSDPFTKLPPKPPATAEGLYIETHVKIRTLPGVAMATSSDLGPMTHPVNKSGYGTRAAAVALGMVYGKPVEYYGPSYASHTIEGNKVRVKYTHTGKGLVYKNGDKLQGFALAGDDQVFHWADAKIDGDSVVLESKEVAKPAAVRYGWGAKYGWANLFNQDGLPAIPFRTDSW